MKNRCSQPTLNRQLEQPDEKPEKKSFIPVASDFVLDLAKLVFGGGIVAGWFEEIPNKMAFFCVVTVFFFTLLLLGYELFDIDRKNKKKQRL